ncbi:hypothetical protein Tco_0667277 [Tanacetum coccineum]
MKVVDGPDHRRFMRVKIDFDKLIWDDLSKLQKKHKEKVVAYTRFISLLVEFKMKNYENDKATSILTSIFSVNNWTLKKDQLKGPPFTSHMLTICTADEPDGFKAPKTTLQTEDGPLPKEATETQTGHSKKRKQSVTEKYKIPSRPLTSTPVVAELHKEALQATNGLTSLGVNGEKRADPQLRSTDEGTINYSFDHVIEGTNPSVLVDKTQSARDGLETIQTKTRTKKEPTTKHLFKTDTKDVDLISNDDDEEMIKWADLTKLVKETAVEAMDMDSPEDDQPLQISGDDEPDIQVEVQTKTKDTFVPHPPQSRKSIKIQDLSNQDLLLQSYNYKLEKENATTKDEATFLKAQPSFLNVQQLTELLVNSLKPELDKMLKDRDFSASLPSEQKGLPTKFDEINGSLGQLKRYVETLEIEVPRDLKELPAKL